MAQRQIAGHAAAVASVVMQSRQLSLFDADRRATSSLVKMTI